MGEHLSIVICGHVDSGKSTTTGRLLFELGGLPERELEKLKQEAERLGKGSFAFAFFMYRQKEVRERGVTISCTTKEFFTEKWQDREEGRQGRELEEEVSARPRNAFAGRNFHAVEFLTSRKRRSDTVWQRGSWPVRKTELRQALFPAMNEKTMMGRSICSK